jgi:CubicO group peptidase (beta-lactamase class C family)
MWTLILTAALAAPQPAGAQAARGEVGAKLDDYLTRLESHGYSGAVLVADREGILLEAGYGLADREAGRPVASDTVFTCGSITKQFTAAAIVHLQARGELSVDEWLADHFDDVPEDKQRITLHDLLTHGSGLASAAPTTRRDRC